MSSPVPTRVPTAPAPPFDPGATAGHRAARTATWGLVVAMTVWRATSLDRSLWWDEVYTAWAYVLRGPTTIRAAESYIANNHLLFSWLSWATAQPFGNSEVVLRLWAFLPGTAATVWACLWLGRRHGWSLAAILAGILALTPLHVQLTTEARGYGLVLLASVGLLIAGTNACERGAAHDDLLLAALALLGVATIPTFALPAAVVGLVVLGYRRHAPARPVLLGLVAAAAGWWWYAPVRAPILAGVTGVGARHGDAVGILDPVAAPARLLAAGTVTGVTERVPASGPGMALIHLLLVVAVVGGGLRLVRRDRVLGLLVLLVPPGMVAMMGLLGMHLLPRYLAALFPAVAIALAVAVQDVAAALLRRWPRGAPVLLAALVLGWATVNLPALRAELQPRQDLSGVAELVDGAADATVVLARTEVAWSFYLRDHPTEVVEDEAMLADRVCDGQAPVWFVEPTVEPRPQPDCLIAVGAVRHTLPQRAGPGALTVWWLP